MINKADYRIPGDNKVTLGQELEKEIRSRFHQDRENRFQLFLLSSGIRRKYLNQKSGEYSKDFQEWYKSAKMDQVYGTLANFTKYAGCGEVVNWVAMKTSDPEKYLSQLPVSVGALYEISQILRTGDDLMKVCLQFTTSRKSIDEPKNEWTTKKPPLINNKATELAIRTWRRKWDSPPPPKQKRTDKRTLPFITITCNGELFDFDKKTGDKIGCVDLNDLEDFLKDIEKIARSKNRSIQFRVDNQLDILTQGYFKRKDSYDVTRNLKSDKKVKGKYV